MLISTFFATKKDPTFTVITYTLLYIFSILLFSCFLLMLCFFFFFFQAEDGIRDADVTGVQTCALPIWEIQGARSRIVRRLTEFVASLPAHYQVSDASVSVRDGRYVVPVRREGRGEVGDRKSVV